MLNACPTACRPLEAGEHAGDHVGDVAPGADLRAVAVHRQVAPASAASMNARIAPPPIWPGPKTLNGCTVTVGQAELVVVGVRHVLAGELRDGVRPARLADRADRRDVALGDVEGVRAEDLARREVDEALERVARRERGLERVVGADDVHAHRPHRALEHGVDAGDRGAVDDVGRALRELAQRARRRARRPGGARSSGGRRGRCRRARRGGGCRRRRSSFASTSSRASVVAMNPAPPVMKIRLPSSAIAASLASRMNEPSSSIAPCKTVLFVGAGRHQRRAILARRSSGCASPRSTATPTRRAGRGGRARKVVDFSDADAVLKAAARLKLDGVLTVSADRAVPGRGGGRRGARAAGDRRRDGAPDDAQGGDAAPARRGRRAAAALRGAALDRRAAARGRRGRASRRCSSRPTRAGSAASSASSRSTTSRRTCTRRSPRRRRGEAILEEFVEGTEMNGIVIARDGEAIPLTLSDRLRPPGVGFGVGWIHVYPATIYGDQLEESERIAAQTVRGARAADRDRVPAADRGARRARDRRRVRGADPGRPDGRPRAARGRRRSRRRADPDGARRGAAGRAGAAALQAAARDPLPHRRARAAADRAR